MIETHYQIIDNQLIIEGKVNLLTGHKSFMSDDLGYHSLHNNPNHRTVSLHLYMDPIDDCTVYNKQSEEFIPRSLSYYSYEGELNSVEI